MGTSAPRPFSRLKSSSVGSESTCSTVRATDETASSWWSRMIEVIWGSVKKPQTLNDSASMRTLRSQYSVIETGWRY